jgi:hypothetical protein
MTAQPVFVVLTLIVLVLPATGKKLFLGDEPEGEVSSFSSSLANLFRIGSLTEPHPRRVHKLLKKARQASQAKAEAAARAELVASTMAGACSIVAPVNGTVGDCPTLLASGTTCSPNCITGYTISGVNSCNSGTLAAATCQPSPCPVTPPQNGTMGNCAKQLSHLGDCIPACNAGFTVGGTSHCEFGAFNPATCYPSDCTVVAPTNGNVGSCPGKLAHGGSCSPACNAGYSISGLSQCLFGTYSSATCIPSPCDSSEAPENGAVGDCPPQLGHGATCKPTCNAGYVLDAPSRCHLGLYVPGKCVPSPCKPSAPEHGGLGNCGASLTHGGTCAPTCNFGFSVSGLSSCFAGNFQSASCSASTCRFITPDNGIHGACPTWLANGTSCSPQCKAGYSLLGLSSCIYGTLRSAVCSPSSCTVTPPANGNVGSCPATLQHAGTCVPACATGYKVNGLSSCNAGNFTSASCEASECAAIAPPNGILGTDSTGCLGTVRHSRTCQPACNAGYTVDGPSSCRIGSLRIAVCNPNTCATSAPVNGVPGSCTGTLNHGGICAPRCFTGYTVQGVSSCHNGVFTSATCAPSACTVAPPTFGTLGNCSETIAHGASCTPSCNFGYSLNGPTSCSFGALKRSVCQKVLKTTVYNNGGFSCSAYCGQNRNNELAGWQGACCLGAVDTSGIPVGCTSTRNIPLKCHCYRNDATPFSTGNDPLDAGFVCPEVGSSNTTSF